MERSPGTFLGEESSERPECITGLQLAGGAGGYLYCLCFDFEFFLNSNCYEYSKIWKAPYQSVNGGYLWRGSLGKEGLEGLSLFTLCIAILFELFTTSVDHFFDFKRSLFH